MSTFIARIMDNDPIEVLATTTLKELSKDYKDAFKNEILLAKVNNQLQELNTTLVIDSNVYFLDITDANALRAYQRSVVFLLNYAIKEVISKTTCIHVDHSIHKNHYCEFSKDDIEVTEELLQKIESKMMEIVEKDIEIEKVALPIEKAYEISKSQCLNDTYELLKYRKSSHVSFYKLDWYYDYFNGALVSSTGSLKLFKLHKKFNGFLIQFPNKMHPDKLDKIKNLEKISTVFIESNNWAKILKVDTLGALNRVICKQEIGEIIKVAEALHEKKISNIADSIVKNNKTIVLISGPTSSGKTTFAKRLCIQLRAISITPHLISLDDYFKNKDEAPRDVFGEINLESVDFVDIKQLNEDLLKLINGEEVLIPSYNFKKGIREYSGRALSLNKNEVLVIEGIHGLNEKLTVSVPKDKKFKIFISALTQLNMDSHNRIATSDTRLIRRIVRDNKFRGTSASQTISMWGSVSRGENENIFPFQEDTDALFNSALVYEFSLLKQFVEPLLFDISPEQPEYLDARRLIKMLENFLCITPELVPQNSILKEFIGGSSFE